MHDHDLLYPLRRLHGNLHETRLRYQEDLAYYFYLHKPFGKKVYIPATPVHTNLGDSAITLAQTSFIEQCGIEKTHIKEITYSECLVRRKTVFKALGGKHTLMFLGGGNMGDQWMKEEKMRQEIVVRCRRNQMVIFPQTIHFMSELETQKSVSVYNEIDGLDLVAREKKSYLIMRQLYPKAKIHLCPDIVLSATMETFGVERQTRQGIMLCMRDDAEKALTEEAFARIQRAVKTLGMPIRKTDMHADCWITKENRAECVKKKMMEFAQACLVITDRLHGMVFAAITGTPCVVFGNYNHKVRGTYEWIKYLPYIRYVESVEEMEEWIPKLLAMKDCKYDNTPLKPYYDKLAEVVTQKCR